MSLGDSPNQPVIRCYNKPAIPTDVQARLTAEGLFVADYDSGWSLSAQQVPSADHRPAAGNTFNRIIEISQVGGVGLIRTPNDNDKLIAVGEWEPNCATFREIDGVKLKGIQMARFGLLTPEDSPHYEQVEEIYSSAGATVDNVKENESEIRDAIEALEYQGRLRGPTK